MRYILSLMAICTLASADNQPTDTVPELENLLSQNTSQLMVAFEKKDKEGEVTIYAERENLLLRLRNLKPKSTKPPEVYVGVVEAIVEYRQHGDITIRTAPNVGSSIGLGTIFIPEVLERYKAIKVGDRVRLTISHMAHPYFTTQYWHELTDIRKL